MLLQRCFEAHWPVSTKKDKVFTISDVLILLSRIGSPCFAAWSSATSRILMPDLWSRSLATRTTQHLSLMPDLWSGSLATRTTGQASTVAADAGPLVRVACDPDHWSGIRCRLPDFWSGSLATRTTGQATTAGAGPLVRVASDPDHWSGNSRCR